MRIAQIGKLLACIFVCLGAGWVAGLLMGSVRSVWYEQLAKPPFMPPGWAFGVVWPILYVTMAVALYLVVRNGLSATVVRIAVAVFAIQLALNVAWTPVFFRFHQAAAGFVVIILLWAAILATIIAFRRISAVAAALLLPYIGWVSFAAVLNGWIWLANR